MSATEYYLRCSKLARKHGFGRIEIANYAAYAMGVAWSDHRRSREAIEIAYEAAELARRTNDQRALGLCLGFLSVQYAQFMLDLGPGELLLTKLTTRAPTEAFRSLTREKSMMKSRSPSM